MAEPRAEPAGVRRQNSLASHNPEPIWHLHLGNLYHFKYVWLLAIQSQQYQHPII